jgi:hypothetical protein
MDTYIDTETDGRYLWSTPLRWTSGGMIYVASLIKSGSETEKTFMGEGDT